MRIAIIGRSEILLNTARHLQARGHSVALVVTAKGAPEYRAQAQDFEIYARSVGAQFVQSAKLSERRDEIKAIDLDVAVSYNYPTMISDDVLSLFRHGILNAHGGDLPRYRGNACQAWALLNGEPRIGLCVHKMTAALDAGDIIARDYLNVALETKITSVHSWITTRTPGLFSEALERLAVDPKFVLERQSEVPSDALRGYPRRPEDGRIDWGRSAVEIVRLVNATNRPYPGAYFYSSGKKVTVWDTQIVLDGERFLAVPGQVTAVGPGWVDVATGDGKVRLLEVEVETAPVQADDLVLSLRDRFS